MQGLGKIRNSASVLPVRVSTCVKGRGSYERFFEYKFIPLGVADQESGFGSGLGAGSGPYSSSSSSSSSSSVNCISLGTAPGAEVELVDENASVSVSVSVSVSASPACSVGILNALIMPNSICVLVGPGVGVGVGEGEGDGGQIHAQAQSRLQLRSVTFEENEAGYMDLSTDSISGKRKKGARKVQAGHKICKFIFSDGSVQTMLSPISGQVLEVNNAQLAKDPSLVQSQPFGCGFIAVLLPEDDLLPTLESWDTGTSASNGTGNSVGGAVAATPAAHLSLASGGSADAAPSGFIFSKSNLKRDFNSSSSQSRVNDNGRGARTVDGDEAASGAGGGIRIGATDSDGWAIPTTGSGSSSQSKASACFAFSQNGGCIRGDRCKFAHVVMSDSGSAIIINEYSTGLVGGKRHKKKQRGDGVDADTDTLPKEQGLCFLFQTAACQRGESCKFVHAIMQPEGEKRE